MGDQSSNRPGPSPNTPDAALTHGKGRAFGRTFWVLNTIEMWERLAYYTLRVMAPIYIMQANNPGGLHLTAADKGTIYAWWAAFQSLLPMLTGGFADRYGYKNTLFFSFTMMTGGYVIIALGRDVPGFESPHANFWFFFTGIMVLATGTAFFKPALQGSLAQSLTKANSSIGWSIFYWIVNVGALIGHYLPAFFLPNKVEDQTPEAWRHLFLAAAAFSSLNFLMLLTFKDVPSGANKSDGLLRVLIRTVTNLFEPRLIAWLIIMSGFWMMMYQLWDLQPNFIQDWIDSRPVAEGLRFLPDRLYNFVTEDRGGLRYVPQNVFLSLNSTFIILGVIGVGWLTRRMRTLTAMLWGMLLCAAGVLIAGLTMNPWILILGIVFFSLGEMSTGPKKSEYLALIAPPGKKALYLGYVNIPVGVGVYVGSYLAGYLYGNFGEKATLALRYLRDHKLAPAFDPASDESHAFGTLLERTLRIPRTDAVARLQELTGLSGTDATKLLWETYDPQYHVWLPFAAVGVVCAVALWVFGQMAKRWSDMNA